jgi:hypothetical protein
MYGSEPIPSSWIGLRIIRNFKLKWSEKTPKYFCTRKWHVWWHQSGGLVMAKPCHKSCLNWWQWSQTSTLQPNNEVKNLKQWTESQASRRCLYQVNNLIWIPWQECKRIEVSRTWSESSHGNLACNTISFASSSSVSTTTTTTRSYHHKS